MHQITRRYSLERGHGSERLLSKFLFVALLGNLKSLEVRLWRDGDTCAWETAVFSREYGPSWSGILGGRS
jgi:hypothetical protein